MNNEAIRKRFERWLVDKHVLGLFGAGRSEATGEYLDEYTKFMFHSYKAAIEDMQKDEKLISYLLEAIEATGEMNAAWIEALSSAKAAKLQGETAPVKALEEAVKNCLNAGLAEVTICSLVNEQLELFANTEQPKPEE